MDKQSLITSTEQKRTVPFTVSDIYQDEITVDFTDPLSETERSTYTPRGEETEQQHPKQPFLSEMIFYQDASYREKYDHVPDGLNPSIYEALQQGAESVTFSTKKASSESDIETTTPATDNLSENNHFTLRALEQFFTDLKETLVNDPKSPQARWGLAGFILLGAGFAAIIAGGPMGVAVGSILAGMGIACLARAYYLEEIAKHPPQASIQIKSPSERSWLNYGKTLFRRREKGEIQNENKISASFPPPTPGASGSDENHQELQP